MTVGAAEIELYGALLLERLTVVDVPLVAPETAEPKPEKLHETLRFAVIVTVAVAVPVLKTRAPADPLAGVVVKTRFDHTKFEPA